MGHTAASMTKIFNSFPLLILPILFSSFFFLLNLVLFGGSAGAEGRCEGMGMNGLKIHDVKNT